MRKTDLKFRLDESTFFYALLLFCLLLPFQFALNPADGIDLAIARIFIPILFLGYIIFAMKNKLPLTIAGKSTIALIVFLSLALISVVYSGNLIWSLRKLLFLLSFAPVFFLAKFILNTFDRKRQAIQSLVIGATILAWLGITQFASQFIFGINAVYAFLGNNLAPFFLGKSFAKAVIAYPSWLINSDGTTYMRAVAIFPDPHMISYYLGLLIPWSVALWATATSNKNWYLLCAVSLIAADILTFTRGGYLALIAGSIIILPLVSKKSALKIIAGVVIFAFLFTLVPHNPVVERLTSSFDTQEGSNQGRLNNWQQALSIISAHPFGVGIGAYSLAVDPTASYREPIYAHNLYLDIAAELGILAAVVFVALLFFTFRQFRRLSKVQPFYIAGVASITVFAVHSLVENPIYSVHVLPLFLIILALSASARYEKIVNPE